MTINQYNYYKELNTHNPAVVLYKLVSKQRKGADCGNSETGAFPPSVWVSLF